MRKNLFLLPLVAFLCFANLVYSDTVVVSPLIANYVKEQSTPPSTNWYSRDSNELVTIQNNTGKEIVIHITIDTYTQAANGASAYSPGITISNCGETTHVDAGSSILCSNNDPAHPVSFASDSGNDPSSGSYLINR